MADKIIEFSFPTEEELDPYKLGKMLAEAIQVRLNLVSIPEWEQREWLWRRNTKNFH